MKNGGQNETKFLLADLLMNLRLADGCSDLKARDCKAGGKPSGCVGETPYGSTSAVTVTIRFVPTKY